MIFPSWTPVVMRSSKQRSQDRSVPLQLTDHSRLCLLSPSKTLYSHCAVKDEPYHRCLHIVRVPEVFVYIWMCDCRSLLDTSDSCFEIESVWRPSIKRKYYPDIWPLLSRFNRKQMKMCAGLVLARICPQLWVWHQLSLPTDWTWNEEKSTAGCKWGYSSGYMSSCYGHERCEFL